LNESIPCTRLQGEEAARSIYAVEYFECSAKTGDGVKHAMSKLDEEDLKRASRLRKQNIARHIDDTHHYYSKKFCAPPGF
jgi:hypothetical protein